MLNPANRLLHHAIASMKALPKRKGNPAILAGLSLIMAPQ